MLIKKLKAAGKGINTLVVKRVKRILQKYRTRVVSYDS
jgi:hypothetical protein